MKMVEFLYNEAICFYFTFRLWYFREDIGINLHHWHWHLVYPFEATNRDIVAKDRRGELFYFMHQQVRVVFFTFLLWSFTFFN